MDKIPSYNISAARKVIKQGVATASQEVSLSWRALLMSQRPQTPIIMKVHGVVYDLTEFKHPGGPISLNLGNGRDATPLFEAHHPFTSKAKLNSILQKYKVQDQTMKLLSRREQEEPEGVFDWNEDDKHAQFSREVVSEVKDYFQAEATRRGISLLAATKATNARWVEMIVFSGLFLATLPFFINGYWFSVVALPFFAWLIAAGIVHDAMHFSISTDWRLNAILGYTSPWTTSPLMWYHQHVIGHHAYPNVPFRDPDLAHAPAFIRVHDSIAWKPLHKFQMVATALIWTFGASLYMTVVPLKALLMGALNRAVILMQLSPTRAAAHVLGRLGTALALWGWQWYVFQGDLPRQIGFTVLPILIHSLCFMFSTQMNHLTQENTEKSSRNFMVHQIVTSHSFSMESQLVFWFTGGLNLQIEHHMFPTVNHCHLRAISPIVRRCCAKYEIPYHESRSVLEAVGKHFSHVSRMSQKPSLKAD
jgi:fatty acid desaturase